MSLALFKTRITAIADKIIHASAEDLARIEEILGIKQVGPKAPPAVPQAPQPQAPTAAPTA